MNLYDLSKYKISKDVLEEFPDILKLMTEFQTTLQNKKALKYKPIQDIYTLIETNKKYMEMLIKHYAGVKEDKGKNNE